MLLRVTPEKRVKIKFKSNKNNYQKFNESAALSVFIVKILFTPPDRHPFIGVTSIPSITNHIFALYRGWPDIWIYNY